VRQVGDISEILISVAKCDIKINHLKNKLYANFNSYVQHISRP
jgi:hypothetical protein